MATAQELAMPKHTDRSNSTGPDRQADSEPEIDAYRAAGVDTEEAESGLKKLTRRIRETWPAPNEPNAVQLDIGSFANVIEVGGLGIAICTDGVGSKALVARAMEKYDTIGIDCVAMNVNDLICVGARPVSMVDYIATDSVDATVLDQISIGLRDGALTAGVSISGGEIAQLKDMINGFDLVGMAIGHVALDRILVGQDIQDGDVLIGIESNGIHSNGLTLARRAFSDFSLEHRFGELDCDLGTELLKPTFIYVKEALDVLDRVSSVKALVHITSDGFLNLTRVKAEVGYEIDSLPPVPPVFELIQRLGKVPTTTMFEVYNMGIGFCIVVSPPDADRVVRILEGHGRKAHPIGRAIADKDRHVRLPKERLVGRDKKFQPM